MSLMAPVDISLVCGRPAWCKQAWASDMPKAGTKAYLRATQSLWDSSLVRQGVLSFNLWLPYNPDTPSFIVSVFFSFFPFLSFLNLWLYISRVISFRCITQCWYLYILYIKWLWNIHSISCAVHYILQFSSVAQSCPALCDPMNCSTPGLPVHHHLPKSTQTHVHWVSDASNRLILCCPLLLLPSIFPSIRVFSNEVAKVLKFQRQHQSY